MTTDNLLVLQVFVHLPQSQLSPLELFDVDCHSERSEDFQMCVGSFLSLCSTE